MEKFIEIKKICKNVMEELEKLALGNSANDGNVVCGEEISGFYASKANFLKDGLKDEDGNTSLIKFELGGDESADYLYLNKEGKYVSYFADMEHEEYKGETNPVKWVEVRTKIVLSEHNIDSVKLGAFGNRIGQIFGELV